MLRYRLYDIDIVFNRTLVFSAKLREEPEIEVALA